MSRARDLVFRSKQTAYMRNVIESNGHTKDGDGIYTINGITFKLIGGEVVYVGVSATKYNGASPTAPE